MSRHEYPSLRQGLVGAWCPSLGGAGSLLADRSGRNQNATLNSGVAVVGRPGGVAILPNGSGGKTTFGMSFASLSVATVSYWFLRTATTTVLGLSQGTTETNRTFFGTATDGRMYVGGRYSFGDHYSSASLSAISLNVWHHFAGTIITGTSTRLVWIDGVPLTLSVIGSTITAFPTITPPVEMGEPFVGANANWANGAMDDIRIYSRALTLPEIRLLASRRGIGLQPLPDRAAGMPRKLFVNDAGTWRDGDAYVNTGSEWRLGIPSVNDAGTWR
jgi:hypothetical protein